MSNRRRPTHGRGVGPHSLSMAVAKIRNDAKARAAQGVLARTLAARKAGKSEMASGFIHDNTVVDGHVIDKVTK